MQKPNYYEQLKVSQEATSREIKKAYHKLSLAAHPDRGGNEELFKAISNAYETLSDEDKRKAYDLSLSRSTTEVNSKRDLRKNDERLNPLDASREFQKLADLARENEKKILSNKELNENLNNAAVQNVQMEFSKIPEFVKQSASFLYKDEINLEYSQIDSETPTKLQPMNDSENKSDNSEMAVTLHKSDDSEKAVTSYDTKGNAYFDNFNKIETKNNSELYLMHSSQTGMTRVVNDKWDAQSLHQSALAWKSLGTDSVTFMPEGEPGAIPADLRETAVKIYETLGITVTNPPEKKKTEELSIEDKSKKAIEDSSENNLENMSIKPPS